MTLDDLDALIRQGVEDGDISCTIIVCAGPPKCSLQGDEAIDAQQAGCVWCKRIRIAEDGSEQIIEPGRA